MAHCDAYRTAITVQETVVATLQTMAVTQREFADNASDVAEAVEAAVIEHEQVLTDLQMELEQCEMEHDTEASASAKVTESLKKARKALEKLRKQVGKKAK